MNKNEKMYDVLPLLPLRDMVVFPEMVVSLLIGRSKSLRALEEVDSNVNLMVAVAQKNDVEIPLFDDIYSVGTLIEVLQIIKLHDGTVKIFAKGIKRVHVNKMIDKEDHSLVEFKDFEQNLDYNEKSLLELKNTMLDIFNQYANVTKKIPQNILTSMKKIENIENLVDIISSHIVVKNNQKQEILQKKDLLDRIAYINSLLEIEIDIVSIEKKIRNNVKLQIEKNQKDYYLNEQIKAIQKELNNGEEAKDEIKEIQAKIKKIKLSKEAKDKLDIEIKKLSSMNPISAEASVVRNYIEWLISLPWKTEKHINIDIKNSEKILNSQHYGLHKVKERILEYLAVLKKSKSLKSPILCLVGPPGVGKTSLAKSIAEAAGRSFVRIALGGVRDEAEIRGHRRTYIGAMPGKIIQYMKKSKASNPVILLDEIDKMGSDFRGDPASALLEVLDHEQNSEFVDHYIEVAYDLSNVMFITTANSLNIQEALLDRMEIIELSGYTEDEKLSIAKNHLVERKMKEASLSNTEIEITDEAILKVIRNYTRESGVRDLDRFLAKIARKVVKKIIDGETNLLEVNESNVEEYAGILKYRYQEKDDVNQIGMVTGLAWTRVGGEILTIEALKIPGKGNIITTGKLGEVMQESIKAAFSLVKSISDSYKIDMSEMDKKDIHVHVPEGATPKDGPSAGIAMVSAIFSAISEKPIRNDVAMTGEVTLRGKVLAIGGLKEKLLAALRAGIKTVIIPKDNKKDLVEVDAKVIDNLEIIPVSEIREVLKIAIIEDKI
jgi:ATP-dependent Lon protease